MALVYSGAAERIEKFACYVFDCERCGDPWGYSSADFFSINLTSPQIRPAARLALIVIITGAVLKCRAHPEAVSQLKNLQAELLTVSTPSQAENIIARAALICEAALN